MPRKPKQQPAQDMTATVNVAALAQTTQVFDAENQRLAQIDAQFGDGLPYDRERIINETRFYMGTAAEAMLEASKRIIVLKEHEPHGEFMRIVEERLGLSYFTANKMIKAAAKFSNPQLAKLSTSTTLTKSKLLELMAEDDEDLAALAEGGTLAGHTLDEIERMTTRELRAALRKERERRAQDQEVAEKLLEQKDRKINDLSKKLHERETRAKPWPIRAFEIAQETTQHGSDALQSIDHLDLMREAILNEHFGEDDREAAVAAMAKVYYNTVEQVFIEASKLMQACDEVFGGYKNEAVPLIDMGDVFGGNDGKD